MDPISDKDIDEVDYENEEYCDECGGLGYLTEGEYDDIKQVRCWKCNLKRTNNDDDMDDNS